MKIAFLLGSPEISGGTNVIFKHASFLSNRNHDVWIITSKDFPETSWSWHLDYNKFNRTTIQQLGPTDVFDVCIATWWATVENSSLIKAHSYAYFVQSIESRFYPENQKSLIKHVNRTYDVDFHYVTECKWIAQHLMREHQKIATVAQNGLDKKIFFCSPSSASDVPGLRVLIEGPLGVPFKNVEKTIEVVKKSKASECWLLTSTGTNTVAGVDRVFSKVPQRDLQPIYASCDVLVKLSLVEGMFGPPLEMAACGGTSIVFQVTGADEYLSNLYNSIVIEPENYESVRQAIDTLATCPDLLAFLKSNSVLTAKNWPDWEQSSALFAEFVENLSPNAKSIKTSMNRFKIACLSYRFADSSTLLHKLFDFFYAANVSCVSKILLLLKTTFRKLRKVLNCIP